MRKQIDNVNQKAWRSGGDAPASSGTACAAGSSAPSGDDLMELVHDLMHQLRSRQYQALRAAQAAASADPGEELTHMEHKVLGFFGRHPGATQRDLAQHSGRDKAQLARLIKALRERGLLSASADATDRRAVRLHLTAQGEALLAGLRHVAHQVGTQAVAGLSAAQHHQLLSLLRQVHHNLQDDSQTPGPA